MMMASNDYTSKNRIRVSSLDRRELLGHIPIHNQDESSSDAGESSSYYEDSSSLSNEAGDDDDDAYDDDEDDSSYFSSSVQTNNLREMLVRQYSGSIRSVTHIHNPNDVDLHYSSEDDEVNSVSSHSRSQRSSYESNSMDEENARRMAQSYLSQQYQRNRDMSHYGNDMQDKNYVVYQERWYMLACLSLLNLLSDWTCYSIAPIDSIVSDCYPTSYEKESLVTLFLMANAVASLCEPYILNRVGLRKTVLLGSILLALGSLFKGSLFGPMQVAQLRIAFVLCGLSQPLYQCTPAILSSTFFAEKERTFATSMALNSNQIGIGISFVVGPLMVREAHRVPYYFTFFSIMSISLSIVTFLLLKDAPPTPPSASSNPTGPQLTVYQQAAHSLTTPGFTHTLVAFTASAIVINTLSANFLSLLEAAITDTITYDAVAWYGGTFQLIVLCSSLLVGHSADHTRAYYSVILGLLVLGAFTLAELSVVLISAYRTAHMLLLCALFVGPLQPVSTEMGVDLVFPLANENTVLVIQQVCANGCSALILPVFAMLRNLTLNDASSGGDDDTPQLIIHNATSSHNIQPNDDDALVSYDTTDVEGSHHTQFYYSLYVLVLLHVMTTVYFSTFRGKYKRYEHEVKEREQQRQVFEESDEGGGERMHLMPYRFPRRKMFRYGP